MAAKSWLIGGVPATRAKAQVSVAPRDRLNIAIGASSGTAAWSIAGQPLVDNATTIDTIALGRRWNGAITAALMVTYFPNAHWGFAGEIALIGGRYDASCALTGGPGPVNNQELCATINHSASRSSTVAFDAGVLYRFLSRARLSPYLTARGGLLAGSLNGVETVGTRGGSIVTLYHHPDPAQVGLVTMLGAGFTVPAGSGFQFRWEARDILMGVGTVTGITDGRPQQIPEHQRRYRHRWSFLVGVEVVFERSRGHRY